MASQRAPRGFSGSWRPFRRGGGALVVSLGLALSPGVARAQSHDDLEKARSLFRQGLSLEAAGNWSAALAKFQEVGKVKLTPQVRFHSARCDEQLGRLNEALGEYRLAEYEAGQQGLPELAAITEARQALEGRVPKVVIHRGKGTEAAHIELDSVDLGESQIATPLTIDPGPHTVVAKLGGDRRFELAIVVKEGETSEVVLDAPADGATPAAPAAAAVAPADAGITGPPRSRSPLPWIVGGVGVAGLGASGVFYLLRQGAKSDLDGACRGTLCPSSLQDTQDKGQLYTTLSMVSLGVGVVGLGVATYLFVSDSSAQHRGHGKERAFVLPVDVSALPHGGAVAWRGRF